VSEVIEVVTRAEIEEIVDGGATVIVDFAAESWCLPCQKLKPHYDLASTKTEGVFWLHADVDLNQNLMNEFPIQGVPTLYAYKVGKFVEQVDPKIRTVVALVKYAESL
jgi:thiol-disulfide isomerase/thioredoxin